jgi:AMP-binding enzyme C-terminal domain
VKAHVSLRPRTTAATAELIDFCKARLATYKYPRHVEIMDDPPKTATGKLLRRPLHRRLSPERRRVNGLLTELDDHNCWTMAEAAGHPGPHRMQHLLSRARVDEEQMPGRRRGLGGRAPLRRLGRGRHGADR